MTFNPISARLSLFYAAYFAVVGIMLPYWPAWLESRGLSPVAIGTVLAVGFWVKLAAHPVLATVADATGALKRTTVLLALAGCAVYGAFWFAEPFWSYLVLAVLLGFTVQSIMPLGEALALSEVKLRGLAYGPIRIWGSVSFIVAAFAVGAATERFGDPVILPLLLGTMVVLVASCLWLPAHGGQARKPWSWTAAARLVSNRRYLVFIGAAGCAQASHAVFYGFGTISWRAVGFGESAIGVLWSLGVVAEIVVFALAARLGRFASAPALLAIAGIGALIRWPLTAVTHDLYAVGALQLLHGLTFGAAHLGAMRYLQDNAPEGLEATAQAFYYALVSGVVMGMAMPAAGFFYESYGQLAYLAMGVLGMIGLGLSLLLAGLMKNPHQM
ncbi:MFS transporter [Thalassobaculum sp. OXR-137]|uniref:MFS transporter n=1 Tax=Thalassobaculum sp. OXR-137 TaxID=3100173 RepID=UPI002AC8E41A|nr:MFS transporter [Thalassobaculum sp. OXR-137]WPZ34820.1 MFS transporter [Thalassobaculum sp. OXR-137]